MSRYQVRPEKTTEVVSADPIDLKSIPCWTVTRVTGGMGWHIGKYTSEKTANIVANLLTAFSDEEID